VIHIGEKISAIKIIINLFHFVGRSRSNFYFFVKGEFRTINPLKYNIFLIFNVEKIICKVLNIVKKV